MFVETLPRANPPRRARRTEFTQDDSEDEWTPGRESADRDADAEEAAAPRVDLKASARRVQALVKTDAETLDAAAVGAAGGAT